MATKTKANTKVTATKKVNKKPSVAQKSAHRQKATAATSKQAFFDARFTIQSLYWMIFGAAAILFALWLYTLDAKVRDLYDQVDANTYNLQINSATDAKQTEIQE